MALEGLHNYRLMQQGSGSTPTPAHKNCLNVPSLCNVRYNCSQGEHNQDQHNPTNRVYPWLEAAFDWFNASLFEDVLPPCLLTLQRSRNAYGFFAGDRFANLSNAREITDEIALNPQHFARCSVEDILSTLAHEMAHHWQHHFGRASRWGYHNKQWAQRMRSIGLIPSNTGQPGGKETGRRVSHYVAEGGPFAHACAAFLAKQEVALYHDRTAEAENEDEGIRKEREKKAASKTKFTCTSCGANAWGKPDLKLICEVCPQRMEAVPPMEEDPDSSTEIWSDLRKFALTFPQENSAIPARQDVQCCSVRCKRRSKNRTLHLSRMRFSARHRRRRKRHLSR